MQKIDLVGSGLVGSLLSIYLAKKNYSVEIFERRPDMRKENISAGRSINLAVSTRGLHALNELGLKEKVLAEAVPMRGRMLHSIKGETQFLPYGKNPEECIYSVSRGDLNKLLMTEAEATGRVRIHFNQKAIGYDSNKRILKLQNERTHEPSEKVTSRLIGTDGSASAIREFIVKEQDSADRLTHGYKELVIPPGPRGSFLMEKNALHIWPRGTHMLIALPNFDGSYTCTLFLPWKGELSFESIQTPKDLDQLFREQFVDALPLIENLNTSYFENPTGAMVTIKSWPWHFKDQVLLVGDSAHGIVPFFGQGMNCGFEDCEIFNRFLNPSATDWNALFEQYSNERKSNSDAIADMAQENFIEMRDKVAQPQFQLERRVEKMLEIEFENKFVSRYRLVTFHRVPYRVAFEVGRVNDLILSQLCKDIKNPEEVDKKLAQSLIEKKIVPLLAPYDLRVLQ